MHRGELPNNCWYGQSQLLPLLMAQRIRCAANRPWHTPWHAANPLVLCNCHRRRSPHSCVCRRPSFLQRESLRLCGYRMFHVPFPRRPRLQNPAGWKRSREVLKSLWCLKLRQHPNRISLLVPPQRGRSDAHPAETSLWNRSKVRRQRTLLLLTRCSTASAHWSDR